MADRLSLESAARVRGQPSPDHSHSNCQPTSTTEDIAHHFDHDDEDSVPLCLRPGWDTSPILEPTLPTIRPREPLSCSRWSRPSGASSLDSDEESFRDPFVYAHAPYHQPPMPSAQQREALLFLAKVQHHSFEAIRLRLNWHHFSDTDIREILLEEMRSRVATKRPMPVGTGHLALLGAAERDDDDRRDLHKSGQFTGGWGDAHIGGYYRILLAPEPADGSGRYRQTMASPGPSG